MMMMMMMMMDEDDGLDHSDELGDDVDADDDCEISQCKVQGEFAPRGRLLVVIAPLLGALTVLSMGVSLNFDQYARTGLGSRSFMVESKLPQGGKRNDRDG